MVLFSGLKEKSTFFAIITQHLVISMVERFCYERVSDGVREKSEGSVGSPMLVWLC